jgi:signal peptidase I
MATGSEAPREPRARRSWGRDLVAVLACIAVVLFTRASLADHYVVPSGSMEPTVEVGDRVVVSKAAYGLRLPFSDVWITRWTEPHRGDVVVLESPEGGTILLKRVIGKPGDTVTVRDGAVAINGVKIEADGRQEDIDGKRHAISLASGGGPDFGPTTLPPGRFLVMGDNRGNSRDGRMFGLVDGVTILGRAEKIYYGAGGFSWKDL